jgi:hypothetical protein
MKIPSYYTDTDYTKIRKQIPIFIIYRSWEPYKVLPNQSLLFWMNMEKVEDFSCLKYSSVYKIFIYIRSG